MGGGDLNMKKSWHPQRMDNQEKVWKREEDARKERQRMAELKRQMQEERDAEDLQRRGEESGALKKKKDRVDWMYHQPELKEEDYLLGKKVDKAILEHQETKAKEAASGGGSGLVVDMARKVKEDPLFAIKKKEISHKKALMNNPIRMKQLQQMLKAQVESKEGKKKAKKTKRDKSEKRREERDSSEERRRRKKKKTTKKRDDSSDSDSAADTRRNRRREIPERRRRRGRSSSESDSSSEGERKQRRTKEKKRRKERRESSDERDDGRTARRASRHDRDRRKEEPRRVVPQGYGLIGGKKASHRRRESSSESEEDRYGGRRPDKRRSPDRVPKKRPKAMDADELARRRAEMMDNAKWRDEQRHDRVKRYKDEESAEAEAERRKTKDAKFLDTMRLPSDSSVEDRIKRNIYSIQRTKSALDKNFARR